MSAALPPPLLVLTDRSQCTRPLPRTVEIAVAAGARAVVLREKDLPAPQRFRLAEEIAPHRCERNRKLGLAPAHANAA